MDQTDKTLKGRLARGELSLCMAITQARTPDVPLVVEASGFDCFYIDMEHYPFSIETVSALCTAAIAANMPSLVRVPAHDRHFISRALDGGASGVIAPHVESAAEARAIVDAARFPPLGDRGVPGPNPVTRFKPYSADTVIEEMDRLVTVIAMVESPAAIEAADEIAAVPGIDVLLVGSNDLALKLGIPGQLRDPRIFDAYEAVAEACTRHGKTLGIAGIRNDLEMATRLIQLGARFLIAGSDVGYIVSGARADATNLRAVELAGAPGGKTQFA